MRYITSVTQKGQVTLPKTLREKVGVEKYGKVLLELRDDFIKITPTEDIIDLAGTIKSPKGKNALKARAVFEAAYHRI